MQTKKHMHRASLKGCTKTSRAYVRRQGDKIVIGNECAERVLDVSRDRLRTVALVNKLTGQRLNIQSDEFFIGLGQAERVFTGSDFVVQNIAMSQGKRKTVRLTIRLTGADPADKVSVIYKAESGQCFLRKQILVESAKLVRKIGVESFKVRRGRFAFGGFGQPLFVNDEWFMGLEYPAGYNTAKAGAVSLFHHPGRVGPVTSKPAVLGVAANRANERLRDVFLRYVDEHRARPVKFFSQLGEVMWRYPVRKIREAMSCREVFEDARATFLKRGVKLDSVYFHGDSQWVNPQSIMAEKPEAEQKPYTLKKRVRWAREILGAPVFMHMNTGGGRSSGDHAWFARNFDMNSKRYYCLADPRITTQLTANQLRLLEKYDFAGFCYDWLWWRKVWDCEQHGHRGHIDGVKYSREAITDRFIEMLEALRKKKPDIFLEDLEVEHSPWWLFYADALWSYAGEGDCLPFEQLDGAMHHWLKRYVIFPMSSVWYATPEPEVPFGRNYPGEHMLHFVLIHYLRGGQAEEFYFNFTKLSEKQKDQVAAIIRWARSHAHILLANSTHILGDPFKRQTYGYSHFTPDNTGIIGIRNPAAWRMETVTIRLDEKIHFYKNAGRVRVEVVYPYREVLPRFFSYADAFDLKVPGDEIVVLEVQPVGTAPAQLPAGCRLAIDAAGKLAVKSLMFPGTCREHFRKPKLTFTREAGGVFKGVFEVDVPPDETIELVVAAELVMKATTSVDEETRNFKQAQALPSADKTKLQGQIEVETNAFHDQTAPFLDKAQNAFSLNITINDRPAQYLDEIFTIPGFAFDDQGIMRETQNPALLRLINQVGPHPNHKNGAYYPRRYRITLQGRQRVCFVLQCNFANLGDIQCSGVITAHLNRRIRLVAAQAPQLKRDLKKGSARKLERLPADFQDQWREVVTLLPPTKL